MDYRTGLSGFAHPGSGDLVASNATRRFRPKVFPDPDLDLGMKNAYDRIETLEDQAIIDPERVNAGLASGATNVTGSQNGVETGLVSVSRVVASLEVASAVNEWVTAMPSPRGKGLIDIYVWAPTAAGNNTPVASTTKRSVTWFAIGARVQ